MIVSAFKNKILPFYSGNYYEELEEKSSEDENKESPKSEDKIPDISTSEQIIMLDKFYGRYLVSKFFKEKSLIEILNKLKDYRKNTKTFQKYNNLMTHLVFGLEKLEKDIRNMFEDELQNRRLNYLKDLVRTIIGTNQKLDNISALERKEEAARRQQGQGLKIMIPKQMNIKIIYFISTIKSRQQQSKIKK